MLLLQFQSESISVHFVIPHTYLDTQEQPYNLLEPVLNMILLELNAFKIPACRHCIIQVSHLILICY